MTDTPSTQEKVPEEAVRLALGAYVGREAIGDEVAMDDMHRALVTALPHLHAAWLEDLKGKLLGDGANKAACDALTHLLDRNAIETVVDGVVEAALDHALSEQDGEGGGRG